jgi:hypothetical protein
MWNAFCYPFAVPSLREQTENDFKNIIMKQSIKTFRIWRRFLPVLVILLLGISCKNKKKVSDLSDTQQVAQEISQEIETYEETDTDADKESTPEVSRTKSEQISKYFSAISNASSIPEANSNINEALSMFSSSEAVVLIAIYQGEGQVDYDEPTTIAKYLNYLKDQKKNPNRVQDIVFDQNGKVKELVLRKSL